MYICLGNSQCNHYLELVPLVSIVTMGRRSRRNICRCRGKRFGFIFRCMIVCGDCVMWVLAEYGVGCVCERMRW